MPAALLTNCAEPGCPELVEAGRCAAHTHHYDRYRGTSTARGMGATWRAFRTWVRNTMVRLGIAPVCGASLPGGPDLTEASLCKRTGLLNDQHLHLHHDPPLRDDERAHRAVVEDPKRVGFLCACCHNAWTAKEMQR